MVRGARTWLAPHRELVRRDGQPAGAVYDSLMQKECRREEQRPGAEACFAGTTIVARVGARVGALGLRWPWWRWLTFIVQALGELLQFSRSRSQSTRAMAAN